MTVKTWRCLICGDPYVGEGKPTHCPFCGAAEEHIVPAKEYKEPVVGELSDISKQNILDAIKLEVSNSQFYFCASRAAADIELKARFKALGKVEAEHASLLSKMIGAQKPLIDINSDECPGEDNALVKESQIRESGAVEHYQQFLEQATEPRVRQIFKTLVEIETTHIELAESKE